MSSRESVSPFTIRSLVEKRATLPSLEIPSNLAGEAWAREVKHSAAIATAALRILIGVEGIGAVSAGFGRNA